MTMLMFCDFKGACVYWITYGNYDSRTVEVQYV